MNNFIGLLDSGVGGLSVLKELKRIMPNKNYMFFGDTKNVPYGTKTPEQIFEYTKSILNFFIEKNVKYVVIACNTTSAVAYEKLKDEFKNKLTIVPLIQSVALDASLNLKSNDKIAVLATRTTVNSHKYKEEIQKVNSNLEVIEVDCTGFVEIVENGLYDKKESTDLIKSKLEPLKDVKRIVLGCTHYPYLVDIFKNILDVDYFNPATAVAKIAKDIIKNEAEGSINEFYVSSNPEGFVKNSSIFFKVDNPKLINLDLA